jgi:hypothetical protein
MPPQWERVNMAKARNYKQEYKTQKERGEHDGRMERQRARRAYDKKRTGSVNRKAASRDGMDLSHKKPIRSGGKNSDGVKLEKPSTNRARNGHSKGKG